MGKWVVFTVAAAAHEMDLLIMVQIFTATYRTRQNHNENILQKQSK